MYNVMICSISLSESIKLNEKFVSLFTDRCCDRNPRRILWNNKNGFNLKEYRITWLFIRPYNIGALYGMTIFMSIY